MDRRNALKTAAGEVCGLIATLFGRSSAGKTTPLPAKLRRPWRTANERREECGRLGDLNESLGQYRISVGDMHIRRCKDCPTCFELWINDPDHIPEAQRLLQLHPDFVDDLLEALNEYKAMMLAKDAKI